MVTTIQSTRRRSQFVYEVLQELDNPHQDKGIIGDKRILPGRKAGIRIPARRVNTGGLYAEVYEFLTNNMKMSVLTIAELYLRCWQIEVQFKRIKQNYGLKYFLGDSENAIKLQIWCSLIADLILKVLKKEMAAKWSFANLAAMIRLHFMTYIDLRDFSNHRKKVYSVIF